MGIRSQNNPIASYLDVFSKTGLDAVSAAPAAAGHTATGGVISDYTSGSDVFRAHVFTSSGTFTVTELSSDFAATVDYLVVAGGGGGGSQQEGNLYSAGGVLLTALSVSQLTTIVGNEQTQVFNFPDPGLKMIAAETLRVVSNANVFQNYTFYLTERT